MALKFKNGRTLPAKVQNALLACIKDGIAKGGNGTINYEPGMPFRIPAFCSVWGMIYTSGASLLYIFSQYSRIKFKRCLS